MMVDNDTPITTREQVADELGITRMTLYRWERKFKPITRFAATHVSWITASALKEWVAGLLKEHPRFYPSIRSCYIPRGM